MINFSSFSPSRFGSLKIKIAAVDRPISRAIFGDDEHADEDARIGPLKSRIPGGKGVQRGAQKRAGRKVTERSRF